MGRFVFWTGIYDIVAGIVLPCPWILDSLGVKPPPSNLRLWLPAIMVVLSISKLRLGWYNVAHRSRLLQRFWLW
jgi:hypothetical protein